MSRYQGLARTAGAILLFASIAPAAAHGRGGKLHPAPRLGNPFVERNMPDPVFANPPFAGHLLGSHPFYNTHFGYGFGNPGPGWGLHGRQ